MKHLVRHALGFAAGIGLLVLVPACDKGSDGPSRDTPEYLSQAVDLSQFFRWTFPRNFVDCRLFIEVDDRNGFVPAGFDRAQARANLERARDDWKRVILAEGVPIQSETRFLSEGAVPFSSSTSSIRIRYVDRFTSALGTTRRVHTSSGRVDFVEIVLALSDPAGRRLDSKQLLCVALHEFGHALGILCGPTCGPNGGHSPNDLDIMFPSVVPFTSLSGGDKKTMQRLYLLNPQILREDA